MLKEEDNVSFYIQKNESKMLKSVSGLNTYENCANERIKTDREPPIGIVFIYKSIINRTRSI